MAVPSCQAAPSPDASQWDAEVASGMAMDAEIMEYMPAAMSSGMLLAPHDQPTYGPHLPGLDAGNVHNNSPIPTNFMAGDGDSTHHTDVRDSKAVRGVCGLRNMGNTCFMNSGLQCLIHNGHLVQQLPLVDELLPATLSRKFRSLSDKAWSGEFSLLHPVEFKETLGFMHGQFRDFRQHDGQEFLALLLDTLHEELNQAKTKKKSHSPFDDISENSSDSQYMSEASTSKLSELEALEIDSGKEEQVSGNQNNRRSSDKEVGSGSEESAAGEDVKVPSIEEFFKKDMKTLNTNVMQVEEAPSNVATGSEKYPKAENSKKPLKTPAKQQRSPLRNRVENDCEKLNSPPKNKKTNLLAAKKNLKGNLKNGSGEGLSNSVKFVAETDIHEGEDPIKRMKMDSCSKTELLHSLTKDGLTSSFHNYAVPELLNKDGFFPIADSKLTNKLMELEGNDASLKPVAEEECYNQLKPQVGLNNPKDKCPNLLYPAKIEESLAKSLARHRDEKHCTAPHTTTSEEHDCCYIPNNQQFLSVHPTASRIKKEAAMEDGDLGREEGEAEWEDYTRANQSPIMNFQGQFKSTVVCAVCGHVSIIYEPFMYLSVPLPRAMEKQLIITFIPKHGQTPGRYLVSLNRLDTVKELRKAMVRVVYGEGLPEDKELVLAEGLDHHISRFLEDGIHLRYVNDSFRLLYAFEVYSKTVLEESLHITSLPNEAASNRFAQDLDMRTGNASAIFENVDTQKQESVDLCEKIDSDYLPTSAESAFEAPQGPWDIVLAPPQYTEMNNVGSGKATDLVSSADSAVASATASQDVFSNMSYFDPNDLPSMDTQSNPLVLPPKPRGSNSSLQGNVDLNSPEAVWGPVHDDGVPWNDDVFVPEKNTETSDSGVVMSQWHSCAICLEEYPEHQLLTHKACGGVLCHACMERAVKHYGQQAVDCPVCRKEIDPSQDYVVMQTSLTARPAKRVLLLPVLFRNDTTVDGETKGELFAYPNAIHTHNEVSGESLFNEIDSMLPVRSAFTIVLTDGRGTQCSRCVYSIHCRGCQLVREVDITLHSDDHLTVVYQNLPTEVMESASRAYDDRSLGELAGNDPLTLRECFKAFTESEDLDEHNPWFCPKCCKPQCARKTIAVCRYPDTLIVYLKRFVYHQFTSTKLENKVLFPVEGLDMTDFLCPDVSIQELNLMYNLQSCVCHFGGVNAGHYTCYVRNPLTNQWQYCNDETISQQEPSDNDASSVYILFYQRRGLNTEFIPPVGYEFSPPTPPPPPPASPPSGEVEQSCDPADRKSFQSDVKHFSELHKEEERADGESELAVGSTDLD
ncbi:uncharacterized protein LOC110983556 isoform X2 [Acanthaster planci]|nr:uncharacterized protein LOC110983556 isoform X2 [Acanthaster planci]XP_022098573.1 uncharacterized protein LOC110983556 isoform X2 [Acanthaster planci]